MACITIFYLFLSRLLAIMFSKLRMSVADAIEEFRKICTIVYVDGLSQMERTKKLKGCIKDLLVRKGLPADLKLGRDSRMVEEGCPW